ncbi:hypothetical protein [Rhodococcus sp. CH91]|uniref:hypothetical protein n=1 Tax=Rhodococcus sp. CH91 TaxID=2910256 RepID=UPI001F4B2170|nr:hypothetical protein [Rhodococcus sp. CH91]
MAIQRLHALGLALGPVLFALSPIFWTDGHYGIAGGILIAVSMVPWVYGLIGEYERLRRPLPVVAGLWLLLLLVGMFGSIAFGLQGFFEGVFGVTHRAALNAFEDYPPISVVLLVAGPIFPLAIGVLGILYWFTDSAPRWASILLCIAAVAFPLARVVRLEWVAIVADVIMVVAFWYLAWIRWRRAGRMFDEIRVASHE